MTISSADRRGLRTPAGAAIVAALVLGALGGTSSFLPTAPASAAGEACSADVVAYTSDVPQALGTLQSEQVKPLATGAGIIVAVVDSGVDVRNAHLAGAVLPGINLVPDKEAANGTTDLAGHGTAIAGEIAARPVASSGVIGLAPAAMILPVRVFRGDDQQSVDAGFGPSATRLAEGIQWAAKNGAKIINVSLSETTDSPELRAAVVFAEQSGALVVASAGNRATSEDTSDGPRYPAGYDEALGVTAANADGVVTDDSFHGPQVDVAAPGMNVLTTSFAAGDCLYASTAPSTSFATGYASAAAALVAEAHPEEGPAGWRYRLEASASRAHPDKRDDMYGWGLIQPYEAITMVADGTVRGPVSPLAEPVAVVEDPPQRLDLTPEPSLFAVTRTIGLWAGVIGVTVLTLAILLRRRRGEKAIESTESDPPR
jgi:membrane-anchored mycosin MYCP